MPKVGQQTLACALTSWHSDDEKEQGSILHGWLCDHARVWIVICVVPRHGESNWLNIWERKRSQQETDFLAMCLIQESHWLQLPIICSDARLTEREGGHLAVLLCLISSPWLQVCEKTWWVRKKWLFFFFECVPTYSCMSRQLVSNVLYFFFDCHLTHAPKFRMGLDMCWSSSAPPEQADPETALSDLLDVEAEEALTEVRGFFCIL